MCAYGLQFVMQFMKCCGFVEVTKAKILSLSPVSYLMRRTVTRKTWT